jgi:hypothetical protein
MSISSISSYNSLYQANVQNIYQQEQQNIANLGNALQSGNLSGAQQAFSAFEQVLNSSQNENQTQKAPITPGTIGNNSVSSDLSALGNALQSQNTTSAQTAFNQLLQDLQGAQKGHHHHHHHNNNVNSQNPSYNPSVVNASDGGKEIGGNNESNGSSLNVGSSINVSA